MGAIVMCGLYETCSCVTGLRSRDYADVDREVYD